MMGPLIANACMLASQGYAVFPLRGKCPLRDSQGYKDASRTVDAIEGMPWHRADAAGIACGGDSRLLVLDIDADKSGTTRLATSLAVQTLNALPLTTHTRVVRTPGGGVHLYIRLADDNTPLPASRTDVLGTKRRDGVALDVRCAGGYVVAYAPQPGANHSCGALPVIPRALLEQAGVIPAPCSPQGGRPIARAARCVAPVNQLSRWQEAAWSAVQPGGIPLVDNDAFVTFAGALASAVHSEGHDLCPVLDLFHQIAKTFPGYEPAREEARFMSFIGGNYQGARLGYGTLAYHAEAARVAALRHVPMTPATPARGAVI